MLISHGALAVGFGGAALAAGLALAPRVRARNLKLGHVDRPGGRKHQKDAIPYGGGTLLMIGVAIPVVAGFLGSLGARVEMWELPASWAAYAEGALTRWLPIVALFFAGTSLAVMGRLDDRKGLGVAPRLLFQFVPALVVVACGVRASLFVDSAFVQIAVSVLWLVFMTNATNFIDNMDGLCVGTGLASACGIAVLAGLDGQILVMSLAAALAGAMAAVLVWNRPSARIYLGDEGSQFAGFMLGTLALVVSFRPEQGGEDGFSMVPFIAPLLLMIVPLCDGVTVIITRCRRGVAPWTAGLDHLSHRLAARVGGREGAVAGLVFVSFVGAAGAVMTVSREADYRLAAALLLAAGTGVALAIPLGKRT